MTEAAMAMCCWITMEQVKKRQAEDSMRNEEFLRQAEAVLSPEGMSVLLPSSSEVMARHMDVIEAYAKLLRESRTAGFPSADLNSNP